MSETYVAAWGMGSLFLAFLAACLFVLAAIWGSELAARICGSVVVVAMFSLCAALFVQGAIDRQAATPTTQVRRET